MGTLSRYRSFTDDPNETPVVSPPDPGVVNLTPLPQTNPIVGAPLKGGGGGAALDLSFPNYDFGTLPDFRYDPFNAPTFDQAKNEPGYKFRLDSGTDALQRSAAAKGVLRTGGTLKDILEYGQNFGAQEYNNVYNRELSAYDRRYQGQKDAFAPQLLAYQLRAQAELAKAAAIYGRGTLWNNPHGGGGGGGGGSAPIPPFVDNPYGDPADVPIGPPVIPGETRRDREVPGNTGSYSRSELWPEYRF